LSLHLHVVSVNLHGGGSSYHTVMELPITVDDMFLPRAKPLSFENLFFDSGVLAISVKYCCNVK
jgi:hypothetical protein